MRIDRLVAWLSATLCLMLCASPSAHANFAGGGKKKTDCYAEFSVKGDEAVKHGTLRCVDGDPSCDTDGACDGKCTFRAAICANQEDVSGCTSPGLKAAPKIKGAALAAPALTGKNCGARGNIEVSLKRNGKKPGTTKLSVVAVGTDGKRDPDKLVLKCLPVKGACTAVTTTTSTTLPCPHAACEPTEIVLKSTPGSLKVGGFAPFPFPEGIMTKIEMGPGDSGCRHDVVVPAGGFTVPSFCIPALQFMSQVVTLGCASGGADGKGTLWDGYSLCASPGISRTADSSDGVCGTIANGCDAQTGHCAGDTTVRCSAPSGCLIAGADKGPCVLGFPGAGIDTLGDIDTTRGGPCLAPAVHSLLDIPVVSTTWSDFEGCKPNLVFDPSVDQIITQFTFILSPTTGHASVVFADKDGDGCDLPLGSAGAGPVSAGPDPINVTPSAKGPVELQGVAGPGPCCVIGEAQSTVSVGAAFSGAQPLYDLVFRSITPNTVTACNPLPATQQSCTLDPNPCLD
jgi:hypothetical protein